MNLSRRLHLVIGLIILTGFMIFVILWYQIEKKQAERNILSSAEHAYSILMATRRVYHRQFLDSGIPLNEKTLGFLPAHALNRISKELPNWNPSGFSFNNVSDKPRNPSQKADALELTAIEHFRQNPKDEFRFIPYKNEKNELYYHYARPIWIEEYCLKCHGERENAPETIRNTYDTAYNYKVGELRGILSIKIPAHAMLEQIKHGFFIGVVLTGGTLFTLWLIVGAIVRRSVLQPLSLLKKSITELGGGLLAHSKHSNENEFENLRLAFDDMAKSLEHERKLLISSEERFRSLATIASDAIILTDSDGKILFWNQGAEHIFGYAQPEIINQPLMTIISEPLRESFNEKIQKTRYGRSVAPTQGIHEFTGLHRDGAEIPFEISLNTWLNGDIRYIVAIIRDLSQRMATERARHELEQQLTKFYELNLVGLTITSPDKGWIRVNECLCNMLEYPEHELRKLTWAQLTHPDDLATEIELFEKLLANKTDGYHLEKRFITRSGKIIYTNVVARCTHKIGGEVENVIAMVEDITEQKMAHISLKNALAEAENFRCAMNLASTYVYMKDKNFRYTYANEATLALFGCDAQEVIGSDDSRFFPPATVDRLNEIDRQVLAGKATREEVIVLDHETKKRRIYLEVKAPIFNDKERKSVSGLVGISTDITQQKELEEQLSKLATTDNLTGLSNRSKFLDVAEKEMARAIRYKQTLSTAMIDLDYFKAINDTYGHKVGDRVLKEFSKLCLQMLRQNDLIGRLGGEEFAILFPETNCDQALEVAERLRQSIEALEVPMEHGLPVKLTASFGITEIIASDVNIDVVLDRADKALYQAKKTGRNKIFIL